MNSKERRRHKRTEDAKNDSRQPQVPTEMPAEARPDPFEEEDDSTDFPRWAVAAIGTAIYVALAFVIDQKLPGYRAALFWVWVAGLVFYLLPGGTFQNKLGNFLYGAIALFFVSLALTAIGIISDCSGSNSGKSAIDMYFRR